MTQSSSAKAIFLAASDIADAAQRAKYLESACGGDSGLRERVEQLLQASAQTADFLTETAEVEKELQPALGERIGYFGDYVLLDELARGASGVVFRARQSSLDRVVALKMLRGHALVEGDDGLRRFKAEAQAAAGLKHANLVPIYEVGEFEGQGYYSMPLIEGGTLISRAAEFREPRKAVALIVKVARAIHAAHEHGLLHRDIKPGNILIDAEGEPQVTDFGIARKMGLDSDLTVTGQIMGTPYYMSPEQARGETQSLTASADVYGIGAVLYELLTTEKPFSGDSMIEVLKKVVEQPLKAPLGIERDLGVIVMKCLEKAPSARYATAAALADDLEKWLRGEPISARPAGRIERVVKWVRRSPAKAALFVLGVVLLSSWTAFAVWVRMTPVAGVRKLDPGEGYTKIAPGRTVDVLRLMQLPANPQAPFQLLDGKLVSHGASSKGIYFQSLPILALGDFDYHLEFTASHTGTPTAECGLLSFPVGERLAQMLLSTGSRCRCADCVPGGTGAKLPGTEAWTHPYGPVTGLHKVRELLVTQNGTARLKHELTPEVPHKLDIRVRLAGQRGSIHIELDGANVITWEGPLTNLEPGRFIQKKDRYRDVYFGLVQQPGRTITYTKITLTPINRDSWLKEPVMR